MKQSNLDLTNYSEDWSYTQQFEDRYNLGYLQAHFAEGIEGYKVDYKDRVYVDKNILLNLISRQGRWYLTTSTSFAKVINDHSNDCEKYDGHYEPGYTVVT